MNKRRGRASYTDFIGLPRKVADSPAFRSLPPLGRALYVDLRRQHNGHNNGHIAAVDEGTEDRPGLAYYGWAHSTVHKLLKLLLEHGLVEKTRQGGIGAMSKTCSLYGFTDLPIVGHKEKGIAGRDASHAYLAFAKPVAESQSEGSPHGPVAQTAKRIEGSPHGPLGTHGGPVKVHGVTSTAREGPRGALCDFSEKVA